MAGWMVGAMVGAREAKIAGANEQRSAVTAVAARVGGMAWRWSIAWRTLLLLLFFKNFFFFYF